jgi:hypothetical protein
MPTGNTPGRTRTLSNGGAVNTTCTTYYIGGFDILTVNGTAGATTGPETFKQFGSLQQSLCGYALNQMSYSAGGWVGGYLNLEFNLAGIGIPIGISVGTFYEASSSSFILYGGQTSRIPYTVWYGQAWEGDVNSVTTPFTGQVTDANYIYGDDGLPAMWTGTSTNNYVNQNLALLSPTLPLPCDLQGTVCQASCCPTVP